MGCLRCCCVVCHLYCLITFLLYTCYYVNHVHVPVIIQPILTYTQQKAIAGKGKVFDGDPGSEMAPPLRSPLEPTSHEATLISKEDIKMTKKLGEGAHGTVFEGTWSNKHGSVSECVCVCVCVCMCVCVSD